MHEPIRVVLSWSYSITYMQFSRAAMTKTMNYFFNFQIICVSGHQWEKWKLYQYSQHERVQRQSVNLLHLNVFFFFSMHLSLILTPLIQFILRILPFSIHWWFHQVDYSCELRSMSRSKPLIFLESKSTSIIVTIVKMVEICTFSLK